MLDRTNKLTLARLSCAWLKKMLLVGVFLCSFPTLSRAETLSLSTFYPSPFGVYNLLRLPPRDPFFVPACVGVDGLLWINSNGELRLCFGGVETTPPDVWEQNDTTDKVYLTDHQSGINTNLKVGIGTASAVTMLHVADPAAIVMRLDSSSGTGTGMEFFSGVTRRGGLRSNVTNALSILDTTNVERFVITQGGNVGIGIAVPTSMLHTAADIRTAGMLQLGVLDTTAGILTLSGAGAGSPNGGQVNLELPADWDTAFQTWVIDSDQTNFRIFRETPALAPTSMMINLDGKVAFGGVPETPALSNYFLTVRGNMLVSTTGAVGGSGEVWAHAYFMASDENLKKNIRPVKGLDIITRLKGVKYHLKGTDENGIGLIAQDVEKVLPELVESMPGTELKTIQYENLIGPLIEALKEQQAQIDALQKELESLQTGSF